MAFFTDTQLAQLSASTVRIDLLIQMEFVGETVRVWNGNTPLVANGETWIPMHGRGTIDGIGYSSGTAAESVTIGLSGLPGQASDLLANALENTPRVNQQLVKLFVQLFDDEWQNIGNPIPVWWGYAQPPEITRSQMQGVEGAVQSISITAENAFFNRSRPPFGRLTDRDQQRRHNGDRFCQHIPRLFQATFTYPDF